MAERRLQQTAAIDVEEPLHQTDQGRLAGAGWTDQTDMLTPFDPQAEAAKHRLPEG